MVEENSEHETDGGIPIRHVEHQVESHEEILDEHQRRISRNENWRLQAQGALKVLALIVGAGGLAWLIDSAVAIF